MHFSKREESKYAYYPGNKSVILFDPANLESSATHHDVKKANIHINKGRQ